MAGLFCFEEEVEDHSMERDRRQKRLVSVDVKPMWNMTDGMHDNLSYFPSFSMTVFFWSVSFSFSFLLCTY